MNKTQHHPWKYHFISSLISFNITHRLALKQSFPAKADTLLKSLHDFFIKIYTNHDFKLHKVSGFVTRELSWKAKYATASDTTLHRGLEPVEPVVFIRKTQRLFWWREALLDALAWWGKVLWHAMTSKWQLRGWVIYCFYTQVGISESENLKSQVLCIFFFFFFKITTSIINAALSKWNFYPVIMRTVCSKFTQLWLINVIAASCWSSCF